MFPCGEVPGFVYDERGDHRLEDETRYKDWPDCCEPEDYHASCKWWGRRHHGAFSVGVAYDDNVAHNVEATQSEHCRKNPFVSIPESIDSDYHRETNQGQ